MKYCPACNFSFPDFHRVCDFDGTELVSDPDRPSSVKASSRAWRLWHTLKSPVLWASLLLIAVLASAFLVAYHDATRQYTPSVTAQPSPTSLQSTNPVARASEPGVSKNSSISTRGSSQNLNRLGGSSSARVRRPATTGRRSPTVNDGVSTKQRKSELARRKEVRQTSREKEPVLTAMLKTTWRVLKKPFKF